MLDINRQENSTHLYTRNFLAALFYVWNVFFFELISGHCREKVEVLSPSSRDSKLIRNLYVFENDTQKCDDAESQLIPSRAPFCDFHDLIVNFSTVAVLPNGTNILPYILLNVSIWVNNPISSLFLRLECLEAPNLEDDYCHNHEVQYRRWGRMIWPCRSVTFSEPSRINYPYFLTYHCFRLFSFSHYRLNVSCAPNLCRKSFIVTIPDETQVSPAIRRFYDKDGTNCDSCWSPLAYVDLTLRDRVMIRYERQPSLVYTGISIAIFETIGPSSVHLFTNSLDVTAVQYEWRNVPAGNFTAYLYASRLDCDLMCSNGAVDKCVACPNTKIYFTVEEDKISFPIFMGGILSDAIYTAGSIQEISLSQRASVFIAYTDDSEPHTECISVLAKTLQYDANVDVFIDQFELKRSETLPLRWFVDKFSVANHAVLIFSEGASAILRGERLIQRQPFPEFFSVALSMLITEYGKHAMRSAGKLLPEMNSRFAFVYMTYSPSSVIPKELTALPITIFKLPEQVQNLISWFHSQGSDTAVNVCVDLSRLKSAVNEVIEYRRRNPLWLSERLQTKHRNSGPIFDIQNVPFQSSRSVLTAEEQVHIAETLNLEPPDDEIPSKEEALFSLTGSPDDGSFDTDDSISDKIHLKQFLRTKQNENQMSKVTKRQKATKKRVERKHVCPSCNARFPFPNKLRLHINSNHSLANVCELCPERFNRFNELRTHMRRAHQIVHQCHLCAYSSSVKAELRKHVVRSHENGVRCTVDGCTATVAYNRLRRHINEVHCSSLQSTVTVDGQLLEELRELESNSFENRSTEVKSSLAAERSVGTNACAVTEFVNIHDNLQPVDEMQKPTGNHLSSKTQSQTLPVQHSGAMNDGNCNNCCDKNESVKACKVEQRDSENICREKSSEVSIQRNDLKINHQITSRGKFSDCLETGGYECQKCGKIFCDLYSSRRHWNRVHLKKYEEKARLKKYACEIPKCSQHFSCPSKLQDHTLAVHNEGASFDCETCNKKFSSRASFAIHLRRYHLVSIREVPHGFTVGNGVNSIGISDDIHATIEDAQSETQVVNNVSMKQHGN